MNDSLGIAGVDVARRVPLRGVGNVSSCKGGPLRTRSDIYHGLFLAVGSLDFPDGLSDPMPSAGARPWLPGCCRTEVCGNFGSAHSDPVCGFASVPVAHRAARRQWGVGQEGRGDVPRNVGVRLCDLPCGETKCDL